MACIKIGLSNCNVRHKRALCGHETRFHYPRHSSRLANRIDDCLNGLISKTRR